MAAVAFLPWVSSDDLVEVGDLRLIPYRRGKKPGTMPHATQPDIDAILAAYADTPGKIVQSATLVEFGTWRTGLDAADVVKPLFRARQLLAFAALADRQFFNSGWRYCNLDTYALVVQRYRQNSVGTFAFTSRRRDGETNHIWSTDDFAFHRPSHVDHRARLSLDLHLLDLLLTAPLDEADYEAIVEFNSANTDSPDVPAHVEIVMLKSAFESLFRINEKAIKFVDALTRALPAREDSELADGPLADKWKKARPNAARPLEAWAREFCDLRGAAAHGKPKPGERHVWSEHNHLAFASFLFPLIFKAVAAARGSLKLSDIDLAKIEMIESYLMFDHFDPDASRDEDKHPWADLDLEALIRASAHRIYKAESKSADNAAGER